MKFLKLSPIFKNSIWIDNLGYFKTRLQSETRFSLDSFNRITTIKYFKPQKLSDVKKKHLGPNRQCSCSNDCCGHWNSSITEIRRVNNRTYRVTENFYQNV